MDILRLAILGVVICGISLLLVPNDGEQVDKMYAWIFTLMKLGIVAIGVIGYLISNGY